MSLAKQIAARMLAKKTPAAAPAEKSTPPRVVSPPARHKRPEPKTPPVPMAERRERIAAGHVRRNAPEPAEFAMSPRDDGKCHLDGDDDADGPPIVARSVPTSAPPPEGPRTITERPPPLPPVPPRPELEVDLVKVLEAAPLPAPAEPERMAPNLATGFRGSCKAVNADTGRQCALLAGHTTSHRHGSTAFFRVAEPNQKSFTRRDLIDAAGSTRHSTEAS